MQAPAVEVATMVAFREMEAVLDGEETAVIPMDLLIHIPRVILLPKQYQTARVQAQRKV